ncbi:hypothetical protein ND747_25060 [Frankia sp. R82]|nr:hypothetical protein [Frankia sp. R82]
MAFVVRTPGFSGDDAAPDAELIERCSAALADVKVPRAVHVMDDFPRATLNWATLNKIAKNQLRARALELAEAVRSGGG